MPGPATRARQRSADALRIAPVASRRAYGLLSAVLLRWSFYSLPYVSSHLKRFYATFSRFGSAVRSAERVQQSKDRRDEKECGSRGAYQTPNHRAAKRSILFAAFAQAKSHRDHTDGHGERGHQYRPE